MDVIDTAQRTGIDRVTSWRDRVAGERMERGERARNVAVMARVERRRRQQADSRARHRETTRVRFRRWCEANRDRHNDANLRCYHANSMYRTAFNRIKTRLVAKGVTWDANAKARCRRIALRISGG